MTSSTSFTLAYGCVLLAALLPLVCAVLAKMGGMGRPPDAGGYDNDEPRAWLARQGGRAARANAAQANSFEVLPFFIGAVVIAHQLGAPQGWVDGLALTFIALRVLYIALYIGGHSTLRSLSWGLGFAVNVALLLVGW